MRERGTFGKYACNEICVKRAVDIFTSFFGRYRDRGSVRLRFCFRRGKPQISRGSSDCGGCRKKSKNPWPCLIDLTMNEWVCTRRTGRHRRSMSGKVRTIIRYQLRLSLPPLFKRRRRRRFFEANDADGHRVRPLISSPGSVSEKLSGKTDELFRDASEPSSDARSDECVLKRNSLFEKRIWHHNLHGEQRIRHQLGITFWHVDFCVGS